MTGKWRVAIGLLLSAGVIAYIFSTVDTSKVWQAITLANVPLLVLAAGAATLCFPLRAIRWRIILQPVGPDVPLGLLWRATSVGFALNNCLPLRLGEVARAYSLSREARSVSFPAAFASLAVDRVFDAVVLVALLAIGLFGLPATGDQQGIAMVYAKLVTVLTFAGILVFALVALAFFPSRVITTYGFFARRLSPTLEARGSSLLTSFAAGLSVLRHPGRFVAVLLWTSAHWLLNAFAFWIGFRALGVDASYLAALVAQTVIGFAIALPQAPSGVGVFQWAGAFALQLFGIPEIDALAWGFGYWAFSFVPITVIGMIYFARMGLSLKELKGVVQDIKGARDGREGPP